jgi:hypothetical protein
MIKEIYEISKIEINKSIKLVTFRAPEMRYKIFFIILHLYLIISTFPSVSNLCNYLVAYVLTWGIIFILIGAVGILLRLPEDVVYKELNLIINKINNELITDDNAEQLRTIDDDLFSDNIKKYFNTVNIPSREKLALWKYKLCGYRRQIVTFSAILGTILILISRMFMSSVDGIMIAKNLIENITLFWNSNNVLKNMIQLTILLITFDISSNKINQIDRVLDQIELASAIHEQLKD